jgi:hypothetical protein
MVDVDNNSMLYLPLDKLAKSIPPAMVEEAERRPAEPEVIKPTVRREAR